MSSPTGTAQSDRAGRVLASGRGQAALDSVSDAQSAQIVGSATTAAGQLMGDQLEAALSGVGDHSEDPLDQLEAIAEVYVVFTTQHRMGFDLIFATELRDCHDAQLRAAVRRVIDLMMPPGIAVSPDLMQALELTEEIWTTAHGYATLFLTGFFGSDCARVIAPRGGPRAGWVRRPSPYADRVSEDTGRAFEIPEDPRDRRRRRRRAVRVILVDARNRTLLFEDSDPGVAGVTWWVTPGGGMDPGETERQTGVREVAEETGHVVAEATLVGPLAVRRAVHGYSDQILDQDESFFLAIVPEFDLDISAHTAEEKLTLQGHRWWTRAELADTDAWIWPAELLQLWDRGTGDTGRAAGPPIDLGVVESESTVPVTP